MPTREAYPYAVLLPRQPYLGQYSWCDSQYDDRSWDWQLAENDEQIFYFREEKDAIWFALQWA